MTRLGGHVKYYGVLRCVLVRGWSERLKLRRKDNGLGLLGSSPIVVDNALFSDGHNNRGRYHGLRDDLFFHGRWRRSNRLGMIAEGWGEDFFNDRGSRIRTGNRLEKRRRFLR